MNEQQYENLVKYLNTLAYPENYNNKWKTQLRKNLTHYFVKNHILYRRTKDGEKRVILPEQVEVILYNLHQNMSGAHLGVEVGLTYY